MRIELRLTVEDALSLHDVPPLDDRSIRAATRALLGVALVVGARVAYTVVIDVLRWLDLQSLPTP